MSDEKPEVYITPDGRPISRSGHALTEVEVAFMREQRERLRDELEADWGPEIEFADEELMDNLTKTQEVKVERCPLCNEPLLKRAHRAGWCMRCALQDDIQEMETA